MRKTVVLASVLKPVDDTRMFEKMAKTISQTNKYTVNIIGFYSKSQLKAANIHFHPVFEFDRLWLSRITASWKFYKKLIQLKPDILIVNTYELLIVSILYRILFGTKLLYDVQEDYYENIRQLSNFPNAIKLSLAAIVRQIEKLSARYIDHFILAERCYSLTLPFIGSNFTVLENKAVTVQQKPPFQRLKAPLKMLFSGTLAKSTGVLEAISLANDLHKHGLLDHLHIIGRCMESDTLNKILQLSTDKSFIKLTGLQELVPYNAITAAIAEADIGLIIYKDSPVTASKIPTKLYEYLNAHLPVISTPNSLWELFYQHFEAAVISDHTSGTTLREKLLNTSFYNDKSTYHLSWDAEQAKLIDLLDSI